MTDYDGRPVEDEEVIQQIRALLSQCQNPEQAVEMVVGCYCSNWKLKWNKSNEWSTK